MFKINFSLEKFGTTCGWIFLAISLYLAVTTIQIFNYIIFEKSTEPEDTTEKRVVAVLYLLVCVSTFIRSSVISYQLIDGIRQQNPREVMKFNMLMIEILFIMALIQSFLIFKRNFVQAACLIVFEIIVFIVCFYINELKKKFEKEIELFNCEGIDLTATPVQHNLHI
ncbi:CLUMA_CG016645, isoform A [Clunio marinus]|uniref:CLUMA_CG016645, isoform A n=1 Tax=Clunio marinus TaxID=568069 RepID=A0A1J1IXD4_9DIPT|nr:CLUMA_CG016645, isoform A [Clunio marinus]